MQRIIAAVLLFFVCTTFSNCDMPAFIVITNDSDGIVTYKYDILDGDSIKTYVIEIKNGVKQNEVSIIFGLGQLWSDDRIREYLSKIRKIEIISSKETILMTDQGEMFRFFKKRRKGLFDNYIKIKVK